MRERTRPVSYSTPSSPPLLVCGSSSALPHGGKKQAFSSKVATRKLLLYLAYADQPAEKRWRSAAS